MRWGTTYCSGRAVCRRSVTARISGSAPSGWTRGEATRGRPVARHGCRIRGRGCLRRAGGAFISHRRGIYYALMTIAFGQVLWFVAIKWHSVTGGEDGLLEFPVHRSISAWSSCRLTSQRVAVLFPVALFAVTRVPVAAEGLALRARDGAVKENEMRAATAGTRSGASSSPSSCCRRASPGLAGALFAMAQKSAYPNVMSLHNSGFVVMMVLIGGGLVSFWGPVIGAVFFILARDLLGATPKTWLLWYGLLFMAVVLFRPEGIVGCVADARAARDAPMAERN